METHCTTRGLHQGSQTTVLPVSAYKCIPLGRGMTHNVQYNFRSSVPLKVRTMLSISGDNESFCCHTHNRVSSEVGNVRKE